MDIIAQVKEKALLWLSDNIDEQTAFEIKHMLEHDQSQLTESFYKDLEFGTGGLRGIMGAGTNRINKYTIGMATQGLANYMLKTDSSSNKSVAIAYDCRNNSRFYAETAAAVLSANGISVYLFDNLRPTPELSFAVRQLKCMAGIVVTASHNPPEYNGYKVYWDDGAQIVAPHDSAIIAEVRRITRISEVNFNANTELIHSIGKEIDELYIEQIKTLGLNRELVAKHHDMPIVYTPIHGSGVKLVPLALKAFGFTNIIHVAEQDVVDGNFSTVKSPNPEEPAALELALQQARKTNAVLVAGTDPDTDRVGIIVLNAEGEYVLLNGNQTASVLLYYLLSQWNEKGKLNGKEFIVKTIVTTDLLSVMAEHFRVKSYDVLTGFKYIAEIIRKHEGKARFIGGGEESYGYLAGDFVRDKDAVIACALIAEAAAWAKEQGKTLYCILKDIYCKFGFYHEKMSSITKKGKSGAEEIKQMMENFRHSPPESIAGVDVALIHDYLKQKTIDMISDLRYDISLPKSDVLQFELINGSRITVRPSGTEPKIKFYFSVRDQLQHISQFDEKQNMLESLIDAMANEILEQ